ncbi:MULTISPECIES: Gp138 family membrane-puncturing spike protein [Bacillus]|uniref:Gp138 family membrane-puncturing spike protein n=1 Tax=Bacillus TaxID=1386 RepID=UPI000D02A407|nr:MULTISPECIES: Gp138 family membrane-puncturing spike protein [Bacillus]MCK6164673.1 hypothetical protein [Bacillus pumilus]MCK6185148.1 hypothetical protein [Bacillus pumilus]PRS46956.1 hypothetical protein C6Y05_17045 [Bacillus sp. LNXM10]PRS53519.1 hypothetical protein C6Y06_06025 [Bacillus sp. MZGC1]RST66820.1 hypothetical protein EJB14_09940 [Bacillus pumilus]
MAADTNFFDNLVKGIKHSIHVCAPGKVVSYDAASHTADIKPLFMTADDDTLYEQPLIQDVLVLKHVEADMKVGAMVFLSFADRALDNLTNKPFDPDSTRTHDITDAVVIGVYEL